MQAESTKSWRVVGASVRGVAHVQGGQVCQDACAFAQQPGTVLIATVADGAGSAELSEIGAALAVETVVAVMGAVQELPSASDADGWQDLLTEAVRQAQWRIESEAEIRQLEPNALASTLLLAVATPEATAVMQIGDGAIVAGDSAGRVLSLTAPHNGEYANTTVFLTTPNALETAQFALHPAVTYLALFSDGLQRLALDMATGVPFAPFFLPLFRFIASETAAQEPLTAFLSSPKVQERSDDDLTLILAARLP